MAGFPKLAPKSRLLPVGTAAPKHQHELPKKCVTYKKRWEKNYSSAARALAIHADGMVLIRLTEQRQNPKYNREQQRAERKSLLISLFIFLPKKPRDIIWLSVYALLDVSWPPCGDLSLVCRKTVRRPCNWGKWHTVDISFGLPAAGSGCTSAWRRVLRLSA